MIFFTYILIITIIYIISVILLCNSYINKKYMYQQYLKTDVIDNLTVYL